MSKSVLISIKPKWCELIASGQKTVEIRKTRPKIETPFKCYIYCTKDEPLYHSGEKFWCKAAGDFGNGKVIGEFVCDQIDEIGYSPEMHGKYISDIDDIHYVSCVDFEQMFDYLADGYGYGWHISDLVIYDNPKELKEFSKYGFGEFVPWKRPPQSWAYCEEKGGE